MPNSIDIYKGIFLHVIPVRIIVLYNIDMEYVIKIKFMQYKSKAYIYFYFCNNSVTKNHFRSPRIKICKKIISAEGRVTG